ncbi:MAG: cell division protein FtsB [Steroidobacteraceae bacterium]
MKWFAVALLAITLLLQLGLWVSDNGVREIYRLEAAVADQALQNATMRQRNQLLAAEVADLKKGTAALEERARSELGMIAARESFFQVVPGRAPPAYATAQNGTTSR